jgi:multidrug efflux pump subunit AcrB
MPHKKNPDVAEILRGKANKLKGLAAEIAFVQTNLPSGYHREMQLIKEIIMPALDDFSDTLSVATFMVKNLKIKEAVALAASEVVLPVLSGTLTTIAPFFPLLFWPGIVGEFMKYLPITLIYTLLASLIVAYVINPVFAISFMKRHNEGDHEDTSFKAIRRPMIILGVIALPAYLINVGLGNLVVLCAILYAFNHFILTPKIIIPFQDGALPRFKQSYRNLISWVITGYRPVFAVLAMFGVLIMTFVLLGIVKPKVIFFPSGEPDYI